MLHFLAHFSVLRSFQKLPAHRIREKVIVKKFENMTREMMSGLLYTPFIRKMRTAQERDSKQSNAEQSYIKILMRRGRM